MEVNMDKLTELDSHLTVAMCLAAETLIDRPAMLAALLSAEITCLWVGGTRS